MFQDMMDRIEDETIRYLFFLQVTTGEPGGSGGPGGMGGDGTDGPLSGRPRAVLPFSPDGDDEDEEEEDEEALVAANTEQRRAAQNAVEDFTRTVQRKKDKEMAELQFVGGSRTATEKKQAGPAEKAGRNEPCPHRTGTKHKTSHRDKKLASTLCPPSTP